MMSRDDKLGKVKDLSNKKRKKKEEERITTAKEELSGYVVFVCARVLVQR